MQPAGPPSPTEAPAAPVVGESQLESFFDEACMAFDRAPERRVLPCSLGPLQLQLELAGGLGRRNWSEPLALRPAPATEAGPRILAWDDSLQSSGFPPPPWQGRYCYTRRGDIRGISSPRFRLAYNYEARLLTVWDRQRQLGLYWTPDCQHLPGYEWAAPMRTLLFWMGLEAGLQLTHAAAVGKEHGILLAGKGGSGKSTTALACWQAGWKLVGDDYCWLSPGPPVRAYSIYRSARLCDNPQVGLPDWPDESRWRWEKRALNLTQLGLPGLVDRLDIHALVLPRVLADPSASLNLQPCEPGQSLGSLALTTLGQLAGAGPDSQWILRRVTEQLPAYRLDLVPPATAVAQLLGRLPL